MWVKIVWFIALVHLVLLAGCANDETFNLSQLTVADQLLFAEAAEREGAAYSTSNGDWRVSYSNNLNGKAGWATCIELPSTEFKDCHIKLDSLNMENCGTGNIRQKMLSVMRHEIRHIYGAGHVNDPARLMNENVPCFPVD